jgi:hypothetical protein
VEAVEEVGDGFRSVHPGAGEVLLKIHFVPVLSIPLLLSEASEPVEEGLMSGAGRDLHRCLKVGGVLIEGLTCIQCFLTCY